MKKKISLEDFILDCVVYLILTVLLIVCLYPVWYVLVASFSTSTDLVANPGIILWPKRFDFTAYGLVFENKLLMSGFKNTLLVLGISLPINIVMTLFCGYFLANHDGMMWKPQISWFILFTMFFSGGMIPTYLNVRSLGLLNSIWAIIIPGCMNVYNSIICKTAIEAIPSSLSESARIDGATDYQILFRIITPLIKATIAVLLLYYGVAHWNSWFSASLYIKENEKLPIQNILRSILILNSEMAQQGGDEYSAYAETIKYAAIVISTFPIMCVYPFLQKYFAKGTMIGAVKG